MSLLTETDLQLLQESDDKLTIMGDSARGAVGDPILSIEAYWNDGTTLPGNQIAAIEMLAAENATNKDSGDLVFSTANAGTLTERLRICYDGKTTLSLVQIEGNSIRTYADNNDLNLDTNGSGELLFKTGGTEAVRIDNAGKVGIGTSTPEGRLHIQSSSLGGSAPLSGTDDLVVEGPSGGNGGISIKCDSTKNSQLVFSSDSANNSGQVVYHHADHKFTIATNASNAVWIDSSQQVGIGESSVGAKLHVKSDVHPGMILERSSTNGAFLRIKKTDQMWDVGVDSAGDFNVRDESQAGSQDPFTIEAGAPDTSLFINSSGNIGIGTNSPDGKLHILSGGTAVSDIGGDFDDLVLQNNGASGISIVGGDTSYDCGIQFRNESNTSSSSITWDQSDDLIRFGSSVAEFTLEDPSTGSNCFLNFKNDAREWQIGVATNENFIIRDNVGVSPAIPLYIQSGASDYSLYVDSNSNVGLGTNAPIGKMHVHSGSSGVGMVDGNSDEIIVEGSDNVGMSILYQATKYGQISFGDTGDVTRNWIRSYGTSNGDKLQIFTNNTSALTIDNAGQIGIGTSSPGAQLHVLKNASPGITLERETSDAIFLQIKNSDRIWDVGLDSAENFNIRDRTQGTVDPFTIEAGAPDPSVYINSSGFVGIGTNSPDGKVHIEYSSAGSISPNASADDFIIENNGDCGMTIYSGATSKGSIYFGNSVSDTSGRITFEYNTSEMILRAGSSTGFSMGDGISCRVGYLAGPLGVDAQSGFVYIPYRNGSVGTPGNVGAGTAGNEGAMYFNTNTNELWIYNGSDWRKISTTT